MKLNNSGEQQNVVANTDRDSKWVAIVAIIMIALVAIFG